MPSVSPFYLSKGHNGVFTLQFFGAEHSAPRGNRRGLDVLSAPRAHLHNPFCERLIGTIRRELLNHVIVFNERHLLRLLKNYFDTYYHAGRCHMALEGNAPDPWQVEPLALGKVGGLHHSYRRTG